MGVFSSAFCDAVLVGIVEVVKFARRVRGE